MKQYVYEGKLGRILVDGVERKLDDLSDTERVTAGEQLLKRLSDEQGKPVADLRRELEQVAQKAMKPNRKQRRAERSRNRKLRLVK